MSCYYIYLSRGKKICRPINSEDEYRAIRSSRAHLTILGQVRSGNDKAKMGLAQFNYSCLPNEDATLKGAKRITSTIGMDIDHIAKSKMVEVMDRILSKKDELGLLMLELSARAQGYHLVFTRRPELSQEENLRWASDLLKVQFDKGAKDITRVFFATSNDPEDLIYLDPKLFEITEIEAPMPTPAPKPKAVEPQNLTPLEPQSLTPSQPQNLTPSYLGLPYSDIIAKWWEFYNDGREPVESNRNTLTFELAVNLRHICGFDRSLMDKVIPCYDGFSEDEKMSCIDSAINEKRTQMPKRLKDVLMAVRQDLMQQNRSQSADFSDALDDMFAEDEAYYYNKLNDMPQGIKESIEAVGPSLTMPVLTAICPCIGALATGVELDVHRKMRHLNLISYIAGDFASGKGSIDPVVDAWMYEVKTTDRSYIETEDEYRSKKKAALNKKEQPEEPKLPVRCLTLNNTVANLAERLANTEGKHGFSFTSEADIVAQKWKSSMSDFSVMLRQAYDNSPYDREARSAEAVNVHIDKLLWNITMCGTPDALYRVVNNYTDGFQSRIAVARTPDNTFAPLEDNPNVLTDKMADNIQAVAHLLQMMNGQVVLPNLEKQGRIWLEKVRLDTMMNDDKVQARQRMRICVTAQRMTCCLMLCKVAEMLIDKYGRNGAQSKMQQNPNLWKEMLYEVDNTSLIETFDVIADSLLDNALYFFRSRIENAFASSDYVSSSNGRTIKGRNDSIYSRLDIQFSLDQALQQSVAVKGASVTRNTVKQMLKNWKRQGLVDNPQEGVYRKL